MQADGAFETWLLAHSGGYDVTISDPRSRVIQIQGPASMEIMKAASGGAIDETMKYFHAGFFDLGGQELYVSRTGFTGELGYEIYAFGDTTDHPALWKHLIASGEPLGMEFSSTRSMTTRRIEAGILGNMTDMDTTMTPFEAGLAPFIDMDKDDFVGKSALVGKDQRTVLYGLKCAATVPGRGSEILDGEQVVGQMTAGVDSPTLKCGVGYARFNAPGDWAGRDMKIKLPDGTIHPCEIVELPFFDPKKEIAKGIDKLIP